MKRQRKYCPITFLKWLYLYRNCIVQVYRCNQVSSINQLKTSLDFNSLHRYTIITVEINLVFHSQNYQATQLRSSSNVDIHLRRKNVNKCSKQFRLRVVNHSRKIKTWQINPMIFKWGITEQESPDDSESSTLLPFYFHFVSTFPPPLPKKIPEESYLIRYSLCNRFSEENL